MAGERYPCRSQIIKQMGTEQPAKYYDEIYSKSKEYSKHYLLLGWFPMMQRAAQLIKKGSILELGCGSGQFANLIHDQGRKIYTGIDFSEKAIELCYEKNLVGYNFIRQDFCQGVNFSTYDNIIAFEVFEHIEDIELLKGIPKGKHLVISLPSFDNKAHVRYFKTTEQIKEYYKGVIEIANIEIFGKWFLISGSKL